MVGIYFSGTGNTKYCVERFCRKCEKHINIAFSKSECTKCYRCISNCPQKAITLLGKKVFELSKIENYL